MLMKNINNGGKWVRYTETNLNLFSINLYFTCDMVFTTTTMYRTKTSATPQCPEMETWQVSGALCSHVQKKSLLRGWGKA